MFVGKNFVAFNAGSTPFDIVLNTELDLLIESFCAILLCNDISQFSDDMRKRDKLKQNRGKMNIPNYNSISKPGIGQSI